MPPRSRENAERKAVTSYDVAERAGVSQSAVSRCFTPRGGVSKATRAKVMAAVDALGYRPNAIARSLITQRSNMVAIILANIGYHPEYTAQLSRSLTDRGLHVLLFTIDHECDADAVIDQIWQYRVDGVIAGVGLSAAHIGMLADRGTPLVFLNRMYPNSAVNSVCCDQIAGERLLVDRLVESGHRTFGIIGGPQDAAVSGERIAGARGRLRELEIDDVRVVNAEYEYEGGKRGLRELVAGTGRVPDAVICASDMLAIGCIDEARFGMGLTVPQDVSVVGFDGMSQAYWSSYDLVTVRQPLQTMVEAAVDMLLARVVDTSLGAEKRVFSGELVVGSSARLTTPASLRSAQAIRGTRKSAH